MIKLPFRYALSSVYAKLIVDDLFLAMQAAASAGWMKSICGFRSCHAIIISTPFTRGKPV